MNTVRFDEVTSGAPQNINAFATSGQPTYKAVPTTGGALRKDTVYIDEDGGVHNDDREMPEVIPGEPQLPKQPTKPNTPTNATGKKYNNIKMSNIIMLAAIFIIYKLR